MTTLRAKKIATGIVWSLCGLLLISLLVGLLVWAIRNQADDNAHARRQIDALVEQVHDLNADAAQDRAAATRERRTLQTKLDASLAAQDALLAYLRDHGIAVPTKYVTTIERRIVVRHPKPTHRVKRHRPTAGHHASATQAPGKSGHAPGHRKHRHGHRGR